MSDECHCSCHLNQQPVHCQSCNPDKQSFEEEVQEFIDKLSIREIKTLNRIVSEAAKETNALSYSQGRQEAIEEAVSSLTELHCLCGDKTKHCKGLTVVLDQLKTK